MPSAGEHPPHAIHATTVSLSSVRSNKTNDDLAILFTLPPPTPLPPMHPRTLPSVQQGM